MNIKRSIYSYIMNFNNPNTKNSTAVIRAVCAIVFCIFTFVYLYFYQADILAVGQHVLSKGATSYDRKIGCIIITFSLLLLQIGVYVFFRLDKHCHALTYFPSLLILAVITDVSKNIDREFSFGAWLWIFPLLLMLWAGVSVFARNYQMYSRISSCGFFSRAMWVNMSIMTFLFLFTGLASNSNAVFHYRMRAEKCLLDKNYKGALTVGMESLETDNNLTMIRVYALAREGMLGEKLFTYPIAGSSDDMLPYSGDAHCMMYPNDSIYRYIGAKPAGHFKAISYMKALIKLDLASTAVKDYILCGYLIDRDLDSFAQMLPDFYKIDDKLPKHYKEALTLYNHLRSKPYIIYHNTVMDTDFSDLQTLEKKYKTQAARSVAVNEMYSGTYWWYYMYAGK